MTTYNITSEVIDTSVVYGPYASDTGAAWIKVKLNSVIIDPASQQRMFNDLVTVLIERTNDDGDTYEHYGHIVWYGNTDTFLPRDGWLGYAEYWVGIKEDGWKYRVTITTDATDEIFGAIEFDTSESRYAPDTGSNNVGIADAYFYRVHGSGGHGTSSAVEVSGPIIQPRTDNCTLLLVNNMASNVFDLPDYVGICPISTAGTDTGDSHYIKYGGSSGELVPRVYTAGRTCNVITYYNAMPCPDEAGYLYYRFAQDDIAGWLAGGGEGEVRDLSNVPVGTFAVLLINNSDQVDPISSTFRSSSLISTAYEPTDGTVTENGTLTTTPGELCIITAGTVFNPHAVSGGTWPGEGLNWEIISGGTELINKNLVWDEQEVHVSQTDEWNQLIGFKPAASSGSSTSVGASIDTYFWQGYWEGGSFNAYTSAISLRETQYCHYVAVETPADDNDLPDADQIRAGNDGFDSAALDYQKRGPDADGTVTFDPFSDESILPGTDITLCYVWEDESFPVYYEITTAGAIYHVAVETPVDDNDLPDGVQIQAGTDGYDDPAVDVQVKPLPGSSGTVTFDAFAGADPATDYTLCFVYSPDGTTFETPLYYDLSTLEGNINVSATTDSLILTEYSATISIDVEVLANTVNLTLTEYPANINSEINIQAVEDSLILTTYDATVSSGTINVNASTEILNLVSYNATIQGVESAGYTGGWGFFNAFDVERRRALSLRKKRKELLDRAENIEDTLDRALAIEIQKQESEDDRQAELRRLGNLAQAHREHVTEELYGDRVVTALSRAIAQGNYSALEALEREMIRVKEEEEFLLTAARIFYYHDRPN